MSSPRTSRIPLFAAILILLLTGWYGYRQFQALSDVKTQLAQADEILTDLGAQTNAVLAVYQNGKKVHLEEVLTHDEKMNTIFPSQENITDLTRMFDDFAFKNHYANNSFFINQLSYGEPDQVEGQSYSSVPITMTVETSQRNFFKFLEYIENSGSLENGTRLMALNAISLQFDEKESILRAQFSLSAYLQNL